MISVSVLTGFLGSGKSTLINRLLRERPDISLAVLVNEYGEAGLESAVVDVRRRQLEELSVSCLCCAPTSDLEKALATLARRARPRVILIEASGLSDPAPVFKALVEPRLAQSYALGSWIGVVDAESCQAPHTDPVLARRQLRQADFVLLTKTDRVDAPAIEAAKAWAGERSPRGRIIDASEPLPWDSLLGLDAVAAEQDLAGKRPRDTGFTALGPVKTRSGPFRAQRHQALGADQSHEHGEAGTLVWETDEAIDPRRLRASLEALPPDLLRVKGYVHMQEPWGRKYKYVIQFTPAQRHVRAASWQRGERRRTVLLFVGQSLDRRALMDIMDRSLEGRAPR